MSKLWTKQEEDWLIKNYATVGLIKSMKVLNRNQSGVLHKACRLKLKRRGEGRAIREHVYDGYIYESTVDKRVATHRRIMEEYLGRKLKSSEIVHHIDGNKLNNSLDNLELHNRSSHMKIHDKSRIRDKEGKFLG